MNTTPYCTLITLILGMTLIACDSGPKVVEAMPSGKQEEPLFQHAESAMGDNSKDEHLVVVNEALNTDKYTYLQVTEDAEDFWIAIPRREVEIGETYYYEGGLLKKHFHSTEFDRVFETVYLVSGIVKASGEPEEMANAATGGHPEISPAQVVLAEGSIKISELLANRAKYEGELVKVTGQCVKVNPMIMNRNWVHLRDGSGSDHDLTVTTDANIPLGAVVSLEGRIALNKDFGAGYKYDLIMEDAVLK